MYGLGCQAPENLEQSESEELDTDASETSNVSLKKRKLKTSKHDSIPNQKQFSFKGSTLKK